MQNKFNRLTVNAVEFGGVKALYAALLSSNKNLPVSCLVGSTQSVKTFSVSQYNGNNKARRLMKHCFLLFAFQFILNALTAQSYDWAVKMQTKADNHDPSYNEIINKRFVILNDRVFSFYQNKVNTYTTSNNNKNEYSGLVQINEEGVIVKASNTLIKAKDTLKLLSMVANPYKNTLFVFLAFEDTIYIDGQMLLPRRNHFRKQIIILEYDTACNLLKTEYFAEINSIESFHVFMTFDISSDIYIKIPDKNFYLNKSNVYIDNHPYVQLIKLDNNLSLKWIKSYGETPFLKDCKLVYDKKKNTIWFINDTISLINIDTSGDIVDQLSIKGESFNFLTFDFNSNTGKIWLLGELVVINGKLAGVAIGDSIYQLTAPNSSIYILILYDIKSKRVKLVKSSFKNDFHFESIITNEDGKVFLSFSSYKNNIYFGLNKDTFFRVSNPKSFSLYWVSLDEEANYISNSYFQNSYFLTSGFLKDACNHIYLANVFHYDAYGTLNRNDSAIFDHNIFAEKDSGQSFFIAKINSDNLNFEMNAECNGIRLKNNSSTVYTYFEWILPDSTIIKSKVAFISGRQYKKGKVRLRAYKGNGCVSMISKDIIELSKESVAADFNTQSFTGCQWVGFNFFDKSHKDTVNLIQREKWLWDFGDGTQDSVQNPVHIYNKEGIYTIRLIYSNGFCNDTFVSPLQISIQKAPKPGMVLSDTAGCAPLFVKIKNTAEGAVDSYLYSTDFDTSEVPNPDFIFNIPGRYKILQKLKGATGCVTTDSAFVSVYKGLSAGYMPLIKRASITSSNTIQLKLVIPSNAYHSLLYSTQKDQGFEFKDTIHSENYSDFLEKAYDLPIEYKLKLMDSCGNIFESVATKTIFLKIIKGNNLERTLQWNNYEGWSTGIGTYYILTSLDTSFKNISTTSATTYLDAQILSEVNDYISYRIMAVSMDGNDTVGSNIATYWFEPVMYVPNAFSPNDDDYNEHFKIFYTGIKSYQMHIYNRWGELVFKGEKGDEWDGKFKGKKCTEGIYVYKIIAIGNNGKSLYQKGIIQVLR